MATTQTQAVRRRPRARREPRCVSSTLRRREEALFERYHHQGDARARDELIELFLPLARRLARRYECASEPLDDLVQVACVGLMKAIDRFDGDRGTSFATYAVPTILGELKRYFRDAGWALHVPRGVQELVLTVNETIERLSGKGRPPTPRQVARELGVPVEEVLEALVAGACYDTVSFDATPRSSGDGTPLADTLGEHDHRLELVEESAALAGALDRVSERDRTILYLRFVLGLKQYEIAEHVGISQMHVSRLIRQTLETLRRDNGYGRAGSASS